MDFQKLLQNKAVLFSIIGGVVLLIVMIFVFMSMSGSGNNGEIKKKPDPGEKPIGKPIELVTTESVGRVVELEALLARNGIKTERDSSGGSKIKLYLDAKTTYNQRDQALLLIVESGLADGNIGLEVFDKGDFTSTKDDKRIRLARAINGELSRLIRKIDPIENASVFISISDPNAIFASMQKPTTATVQLVIPVGEKLTKDKIRAINNLLLGSVSGLEPGNISITDTNGNVYTSMASSGDDALDKVQENDEYMKAKVQAQLDKLLGRGNYVVTVSTYLRQVPMERSSVIYDPKGNVVLSEQEFQENLGDKNNESGQVTNAVSLYLPTGLPQSANTDQSRNYSRTALEKQYGSTKTQVAEYLKPGMIEDISIAVTIEHNTLPENISLRNLKNLIATAASPKVNPDNVEIIFSESARPVLAGDKDVKQPTPESSGLPWWTLPTVVAGTLLIVILFGWFILTQKVSMAKAVQDAEIRDLKELASRQENQLQEVNQRAQVLLAQQDQLQQSLKTIRETPVQPVQAIPVNNNVVQEMHENLADDENEVALQLKNWIESDD